MTSTIWLTLFLLLFFFSLMLGVGVYCRKRANNVDGFVLGGRNVGPWLTAFAFGTSYFSAVIFVGYAGQFGWNFGLASTWIGLGNAFIGSLLAWSLLGRRTRVMTQHLGSKTMPDFFGKRFTSDKLKIAASMIVFVFLIPYTASLYNGLSSLISVTLGLTASWAFAAVVIVMAILTGAYVLFGGYMAAAVNDFIQGIVMLAGIVAVIAAVLSQNGGLMEAITQLSTYSSPYENTAAMQGVFTSFLGPQPLYLLFVVLLTSLGTWGLPQMVGKFYSITDEKAIKKGTIISTVFALVVAGGCYFLGGFSRLYTDQLYDATGMFLGSDRIIPLMLSQLHSVIIAVVIILVFAASMSTLSSLVITSSSTLTLDVLFHGRAAKEKTKLRTVRLFIVFFILLSVLIAILKDYVWSDSVFIAQMMGVSWGALAGAFLAPFLYGLYWKGTTQAGVAASFIVGAGMEIVQLLYSIQAIEISNPFLQQYVFFNSLYSGVWAMLLGLVVVPLVSAFTQKTLPKGVGEMFACYNQKILVSVKRSLDD